jgi:hypothetical protein
MKLYTVDHQIEIFDVLRGCGLSRCEVGSFYALLLSLEKGRGILDVINTLKLRSEGLLMPLESKFRRHSDNTWLGAWRIISRHASQGRRGLRNMLRVLKLGGLFTAPDPIRKDYLRVGVDISSQPELSYDFGPYRFTSYASLVADRLQLSGLGYETDYPCSTTVVPLAPGKNESEYNLSPQVHIESLDHCPRLVLQFFRLFKELVGYSLPDQSHYETLVCSKAYKHDVVGSISILTGDRGMKKRAVVNPFRLLQLGCSRLSNYLYSYLAAYDTCYVTDQEGGAVWVHQRLAEGLKLSSIDLKSASDNIPMLPQLQLVEQLFPVLGEELELFKRISRSHWWTPYEDVQLKYTRGHGMGLKGSFPLFTTWLLHMCEHVTEGRKAYAIVGDDLVIEAAFTEPVLRILGRFGIPVNYRKSILNSNIAEFVGRIIDVHGNLEVYKASPLKLISDPLGLVRQYGAKALNKTSLKHKISESRRATFLQEIERRRNQSLFHLLVGFCKNQREKDSLLGTPPENFSVGGVPDWLVSAWLAETDAPWMSINFEEETVMQDLQFRPDDRPLYLVQLWQFRQNPSWAVSSFNAARKLLNTLSAEQFVERQFLLEQAEYYRGYLRKGVPNHEATQVHIKLKKLLSPEKLELQKLRTGRAPLSYILKMGRLTKRLIASFVRTLRS